MRTVVRVGLAAVALLLAPGAWAETVNRIVAIVNDDVLTSADIRQRMRQILREHRLSDPTAVELVELERIALRSLIEQRLMLHEAEALELSVAPSDVRERLEAFEAQFESRAAFDAWLAEEGLSEGRLRQTIREQLLVMEVIDRKVRSTLLVSPRELSERLQTDPDAARPGERVRLSHILVRVTEERSEAEARRRIEQIAQELEAGADFAELARRSSEDARGPQGGDMGWVARGELLPELEAAVAALEVGARSAPIQTRLGFHLLRVEERRAAEELSVQEAHQAVFQQIYEEKFKRALDRWLGELRRRAYIEIFPDAS